MFPWTSVFGNPQYPFEWDEMNIVIQAAMSILSWDAIKGPLALLIGMALTGMLYAHLKKSLGHL